MASKVLNLDADRVPPAIELADGHDYHKTNKWVLFGHPFAAIAAAGPLLGPVLAAQFGWLPGTLWIIIGCVLGGAVHDMVVLFASVRYKGRSLAHIAEEEIGHRAGIVASFAINGVPKAYAALHMVPVHLPDLGRAVGEQLQGRPGGAVSLAVGYLVYTGEISTIWPLFGMANQLLATCALIVGTTMLIRHDKLRYAWTTAIPGLFMIPVCFTAGYQTIVYNYLPRGLWLLVTFSVVSGSPLLVYRRVLPYREHTIHRSPPCSMSCVPA